MKKIIAGLLMSFALLVSSPAISAECTLTSADFMAKVEKSISRLHTYSGDTVKVVSSKVGVEADTMIVGELKDGTIGLALISNGCIVQGTITQVPVAAYFQFLKNLGLDKLQVDIGANDA